MTILTKKTGAVDCFGTPIYHGDDVIYPVRVRGYSQLRKGVAAHYSKKEDFLTIITGVSIVTVFKPSTSVAIFKSVFEEDHNAGLRVQMPVRRSDGSMDFHVQNAKDSKMQ